MDATEVLRVLDGLDAAGVRAGVTGGWGIDALLRWQTREHGDVDLGVPSDSVDTAIEALRSLGYIVAADERPARIVLERGGGKVDLHPIVLLPSGAGVQTVRSPSVHSMRSATSTPMAVARDRARSRAVAE